MAEARKYPVPQGNPETATVLEAARQGKFLIKRCTACGEAHYFPRSICPFCFSDKTVWEEKLGRGGNLHVQPDAQIRDRALRDRLCHAEEGPSLLTNFVDCDMASLKIGQKVKVVFKPTDGAPLPFFTVA